MPQRERKGLGRALMKHQNQMIRNSKEKGKLYRSQQKKLLESVTSFSNIDAVVKHAGDARLLFSALNSASQFPISLECGTNEMSMEERIEQQKKQKKEEALHATSLKIPRKPPMNAKMFAKEQKASEKQALLEWRCSLESLVKNENLVLTPFELNLDVWRKLWMTIIRCDLIVMVVDARDPLFYRCPDLEAYVREIDEHKRTLLLVNKADLLPFSVREKWANYFHQHGILFLFWSAKAASAAASAASDLGQQDDVCGRDELLARLQSEAEGIVSMRGESRAQVRVGFVGYPNVGKSSTINALCGKKRTGVTSTPGKTKLCQTFKMSEKLEIWDCPGLVFPSFTRSKHDMIASGVLHIDRLTDHRAPVQVVADRVPRSVIERVYNIALPKPKPYEPKSRPPLASELLRAYCASRRHVASSGLPDETRASRQILKDYINGKLPHYEMPPGMSDVEDDDDDDGDDDDDLNCFDKLPHLEMPPGMSDDEERETDGPVVEDGDDDDELDLERVLDDLKSFDVDNGLASTVTAVKKSSSKHHKKPQRKKSRLWRVTNNGGDGMPVFRKPARGGGPVTAC